MNEVVFLTLPSSSTSSIVLQNPIICRYPILKTRKIKLTFFGEFAQHPQKSFNKLLGKWIMRSFTRLLCNYALSTSEQPNPWWNKWCYWYCPAPQQLPLCCRNHHLPLPHQSNQKMKKQGDLLQGNLTTSTEILRILMENQILKFFTRLLCDHCDVYLRANDDGWNGVSTLQRSSKASIVVTKPISWPPSENPSQTVGMSENEVRHPWSLTAQWALSTFEQT